MSSMGTLCHRLFDSESFKMTFKSTGVFHPTTKKDNERGQCTEADTNTQGHRGQRGHRKLMLFSTHYQFTQFSFNFTQFQSSISTWLNCTQSQHSETLMDTDIIEDVIEMMDKVIEDWISGPGVCFKTTINLGAIQDHHHYMHVVDLNQRVEISHWTCNETN